MLGTLSILPLSGHPPPFGIGLRRFYFTHADFMAFATFPRPFALGPTVVLISQQNHSTSKPNYRSKHTVSCFDINRRIWVCYHLWPCSPTRWIAPGEYLSLSSRLFSIMRLPEESRLTASARSESIRFYNVRRTRTFSRKRPSHHYSLLKGSA